MDSAQEPRVVISLDVLIWEFCLAQLQDSGQLAVIHLLSAQRNYYDDSFSSQQAFDLVIVTVLDINDNVPEFGSTMYAGMVQENAQLGTVVEVVSH